MKAGVIKNIIKVLIKRGIEWQEFAAVEQLSVFSVVLAGCTQHLIHHHQKLYLISRMPGGASSDVVRPVSDIKENVSLASFLLPVCLLLSPPPSSFYVFFPLHNQHNVR